MKHERATIEECADCGGRIVWGRTVTSEFVALDAALPIFRLSGTSHGPDGTLLWVSLQDTVSQETVGLGVMAVHRCPGSDRTKTRAA